VDQSEFEQMVRVVAEEVVRYLGAPEMAISRRAVAEGEICPDCDLNCAEKCARKTRAVVEAGADRISCGPSVIELEAGFAGLIDHTLLKPEASRDDIRKLCQEAVRLDLRRSASIPGTCRLPRNWCAAQKSKFAP
jgi:hypothetical protein